MLVAFQIHTDPLTQTKAKEKILDLHCKPARTHTHTHKYITRGALQADLPSHTHYFGSDGTTASFPRERTNAREDEARETRRC